MVKPSHRHRRCAPKRLRVADWPTVHHEVRRNRVIL